jgi:hypothetical protein
MIYGLTYLVDCGDSVDLAELSKYQQKDNHFQATPTTELTT